MRGAFEVERQRTATDEQRREVYVDAVRDERSQRPAELFQAAAIRHVERHGGVRLISQAVGNEGRKVAARPTFDEHTDASLVHGVDRFAKLTLLRH